MKYCLKVIYMNHLLFTFNNINVKVKKWIKITEKLRRYTFKMICILATGSIRVQKLVVNGSFDNVR